MGLPFAHVADARVRAVLSAVNPDTVNVPDLRYALDVTLACVDVDREDETVPADMVAARLEASSAAFLQFWKSSKAGTVNALRTVWSI